jgi:hypothetical protein
MGTAEKGLRGGEGKQLRGEVLAATGCGHGGPPTCMSPLLSPCGRQEAAQPRAPRWGGEQGMGLGRGLGWAACEPHIFPKVLKLLRVWNQEEWA